MSENPHKWRRSDGTPQTGRIEYEDRVGRRGTKDGSQITWPLIGHSDDVVYWRPSQESDFS